LQSNIWLMRTTFVMLITPSVIFVTLSTPHKNRCFNKNKNISFFFVYTQNKQNVYYKTFIWFIEQGEIGFIEMTFQNNLVPWFFILIWEWGPYQLFLNPWGYVYDTLRDTALGERKGSSLKYLKIEWDDSGNRSRK
jgi:hypothetical protein